MFYPENVERQILHNSRSKVPYDNKPLIRSYNNPNTANPIIHKPERKIGGGPSGGGPSGGGPSGVSTLKPAKLLKSSSMSGGKKPSAWQTLIKNTMKEEGLNMKEAIKFIKSNNLY